MLTSRKARAPFAIPLPGRAISPGNSPGSRPSGSKCPRHWKKSAPDDALGLDPVAHAPHELEPRPGGVDRAHLDVYQPGGEPDVADKLFVDLGFHGRGFLGPGDPDHAVL